MTQVIPAKNHPLKIKSEVVKTESKSCARQNKIDQQLQLAADVEAFLKAGGSVQELSGPPEVTESRSAHSWMGAH